MEQAHRFLATLVTVLIVTLAVVAWRAGAIATRVRGPAMASVGLIIVQIVLGAVTVVTNNAPVTVALHLLVATLFLGVVTLCAVSSFLEPSRTWSWRRPGRLAWSALGALYFVIISGSVVVDGGAQSACPSWPLCQSSHSPFGLVAIQFAHRSMVLVGSILVVCFMWNVLHSPFVVRIQRRLVSVALILLVLQIAAGGISALDRARAAAADVHLALASALWTVVVALFCLCMRGPEPVTMSNDIVRAPTNAWR